MKCTLFRTNELRKGAETGAGDADHSAWVVSNKLDVGTGRGQASGFGFIGADVFGGLGSGHDNSTGDSTGAGSGYGCDNFVIFDYEVC